MPGLSTLFSHTRNRRGLFIIIYVTCLLILRNWVFGPVVKGLFGIYLLPGIMWILLAFMVTRFPGRRPAAKRRFRIFFYWLAFICGIIAIITFFASGMLVGFGRSPYDQSFKGIILNILSLGTMLAGMELGRSWLINTIFRKNAAAGVGLTALLFSLFWFSFNQIPVNKEGLEVIKFIGGTYLPALSENVLSSYLALMGGAAAAVIYRGILLAYHWFSPILPNLNWMTQAFLGTFAPVFSLAMVHQLYLGEAVKKRRLIETAESPMGWIVSSVISILVIWFSVGVFSIFPSVIISGSMSPVIKVGDVIVVKTVSAEEVEAGDIIQFREEKIRVAHRVIEVAEDERGLPVFITKGDANKQPDSEPVLPEQLVGKVIYVVPKIGWITIGIRSPG